jgi:hypothetical protein
MRISGVCSIFRTRSRVSTTPAFRR